MAKKKQKPAKPYSGFPLTAHPNGRWCKKIRGKLHYFGPWADWQAALELFHSQRDALYSGRTPQTLGATLADAGNLFLNSKHLAQQAGEISPRSFADYEATTRKIVGCLGKSRPIESIGPLDLERLRASLARGVGPKTLKNDLTRVRMFFLYVNENDLTKREIKYRKILKTPSRRVFRKLANERGERMFTRAELLAMIDAASVHIRAMIYLGINCGFGNKDCATLPLSRLDLSKGWHTFSRPKTYTPRRCPLWPETIDALREAIEQRPKPCNESYDDFVFLRRTGRPWLRQCAISGEFRKLLQRLGIYVRNVKTFYSLRRTFETVAASCGEQVATDFIMGHTPTSDDMAAVYRQKVYDGPLLKVTGHVRNWLKTTSLSVVDVTNDVERQAIYTPWSVDSP